MGVFSERMQEWVAISFSMGSSQPRGQTCVFCVSCFAGGFFTAELWRKPFIEVYLIYSIVLVYDVQRSVLSLPTHTHTHTHLLFIYMYIFTFTSMVYYRILNTISCAIQEILVIYLFYT